MTNSARGAARRITLGATMNPFRRFLIALLVCSALAFAILGTVIDHVLSRQMLDREGVLSSEAVRLLAHHHLSPEKFRDCLQGGEPGTLEHITDHFTSIPEILYVKIYDEQGTIVWSIDPREIGSNSPDNLELRAALNGHTDIKFGRVKSEHAFMAEWFNLADLIEVYVPLTGPDGQTYAVVELYKDMESFAGDVARARLIVWASCAGIGILLFVVLARVFQSARHRERELSQRTKDAEAQLLQGEKLRLAGEMAAAIAHEINNPLGILMGKAHELRATFKEKGIVQQENFDVFIREIGRIRDVSRSLLLLARRSDPVLEPTDINQVLREIQSFVAPSFARANITIVSEPTAALPQVKADANQLKQVLLNLLQNAKDAMPGGGTINLRTGALDGAVYAEVADSGVGIAPQDIERVFDPFFSTKMRNQGVGLGLSVSYRIVNGHGGEIEVSSELGHGSVFRVVIPALA